MEYYFIHAPYFLNGHKNVMGMAIVDEANYKLHSNGICDADSVQRELDNIDAELKELYSIKLDWVILELEAEL
jgi:hypothetical protein